MSSYFYTPSESKEEDKSCICVAGKLEGSCRYFKEADLYINAGVRTVISGEDGERKARPSRRRVK